MRINLTADSLTNIEIKLGVLLHIFHIQNAAALGAYKVSVRSGGAIQSFLSFYYADAYNQTIFFESSNVAVNRAKT